MPLQIEILSRAEIEQVWKQRARAENFAEYVAFINMRDVGDSFRLTIDKGEKNADSARVTKHNFSEAAKERMKAQRDENGRIEVVGGKYVPVLAADGTTVPDPVVLRWKVDSHVEKRKQKKDGKDVEVEVKVIDKLTALLVATTDVKKRGPRKPKDGEMTPEQIADHAVVQGSANGVSEVGATPAAETPAAPAAVA